LSENFRAIRTALYFSGGREHRVIQTTSPVPGDGKSTLTANLAISIAQSSKRVLLLDADFRRPTQHKLFGLPAEVGLASVVDGQADPHQAVQQTAVPNLSIMACGPRPHNPAELLTSPKFEELLAVLKEQYDFVLVDTPPLLAVTDPSVVAARVDGVLLALRIRKNGRPNAERARKILQDVNANVVGVVVNGLDGKTGSYGYYSNYRKGYGYGYSYSYKYGYGQESDQAIDKYFDEEKHLTAAKN
jgi:capsular exopolysaccharide synthesis family protein